LSELPEFDDSNASEDMDSFYVKNLSVSCCLYMRQISDIRGVAKK